ncbi:helicase C-terminal domain-containing protein [Microbacterium soli]|uniref:helicase C-terminal domain-containing protein n=1 Tax=Microbacterium soli TaxID=446075 RepID=UPI0031D05F4E
MTAHRAQGSTVDAAHTVVHSPEVTRESLYVAMTRGRESKNNQIVRRYGFYWRYDTPAQLRLLGELWPLVNDRHNFLTPTKKPIGWDTDGKGRRRRVYDTLATPFDRLLRSGVLTSERTAELTAYRDSLNPAHIAREIDRIQQRLTWLAADKTRKLEAAELAKQPDPTAGVKPARTRKKQAS